MDRLIYLSDSGVVVYPDVYQKLEIINNVVLSQYYHITYDMRQPYYVYGGLQDNGNWVGPSATRAWEGIVHDDWKQIGFGDGMYHSVDPANHRYIYSNEQNGDLQRVDPETGDRLDLKPTPPAGEPEYRWDWVTPSLVSRHDPRVIYFGANRLLISRDRGVTWEWTEDLF